MARLHTKILHWGNKYDGPNTYKMGREGALEDALWPEDELVDYVKPTRGQKKKRPKKKPGCPENNGKGHVYVWETHTQYGHKYTAWGWVQDKTKVYTVDLKICCGCGKVSNKRYNW